MTEHFYNEVGDRIETMHRLVTIGTKDGQPQQITESWEYNPFGQMIEYVNPTGRVDTYSYYDSGPMNGYLESEIVADNDADLRLTTTYEYDGVGNVTKTIDPRGHDTSFEINALNQVVRSGEFDDPLQIA